jgi:hypothetical protein
MIRRYRLTGAGLMLVLSLILTASPITAAQVAGAATPQQQLPPLPEWPIIGPILRLLGVAQTEVPVAPVPDPSLPEIRVVSWTDVQGLDQLEPGERVRVIASEADINSMAQEIIRERANENLSFRVAFEPNQAAVQASVDTGLLEEAGLSLPGLIRGTLRVEATGSATAAACMPVLGVGSLQVNGWGIGLRAIAQRFVNTQLPEAWPDELCVERILLMDGEAALEGYRVR